MNDGVVKLLNDWWHKPFNPEGDVFDWTLTFGFIVLMFFLWGRIVNKIV